MVNIISSVSERVYAGEFPVATSKRSTDFGFSYVIFVTFFFNCFKVVFCRVVYCKTREKKWMTEEELMEVFHTKSNIFDRLLLHSHNIAETKSLLLTVSESRYSFGNFSLVSLFAREITAKYGTEPMVG
jgi:hypothetical protein